MSHKINNVGKSTLQEQWKFIPLNKFVLLPSEFIYHQPFLFQNFERLQRHIIPIF
jgi:hypothetical protein